MRQQKRLRPRFRWGWAALTLPFALLGACGNSTSSDRDPKLPANVGGAPPVQQPTLAGTGAAPALGLAGAGGSALPDPCAVVAPGRYALIDDFEDGDSIAVPEADRESYWFTVHDDSKGTIVPDSQFVPALGGAHGSILAAHVTASGFSIWGGALTANISHLAGGIRCPFNASGFSGLRFNARGSGRVRVTLSVPDVVDEQYGGTCRPSAGEVCYDTHGAWFVLTPGYRSYAFRWSDFVQRGFGKVASFQPGRIMAIQFNLETAELPIDVWIDDVSWDDGSPVTDPQSDPGAAGSGGSGGADADAAEGGAAGTLSAAGASGTDSP